MNALWFFKKETSKMRDFLLMNKGEVCCSKIYGKTFSSPEEHSEYIQNGGCKSLIDMLATT